MAPIRRYLRITKYSVLEVRIYLEKPSDAPWLLSSRDPVLPRIMQEIRPKVLPKLREENENSKKKGSKKKRKGIKDTVVQADFEVVMFLTEATTRHSLITKHKQFADKSPIKSTGSKLTRWLSNTHDSAIDVEAHVPGLLREDSDELPKLSDVPKASKKRKTTNDTTLFVQSSDEEAFEPAGLPQSRKKALVEEEQESGIDDKKKLGLNTSYDGFSLYGKILCLIVKRKESMKTAAAFTNDLTAGGSQMMESWISTQVNQVADLDDEG